MKFSERNECFGTSIIREMFALLKDPDIISFAGGEPAEEMYPMEHYKIAAKEALDEYGAKALSYSATEGFEPLREIIAKERMRAVGVTCEAANIMVTNGSQQGIDFAARLFVDKDDVIICEGPTYLAAINTFQSYMGKVVQVPTDDDGMQMDKLEECLKANPNTKFIYTIPDFQNPSGICMSVERRKQMVALAEKYDVPILEDNPYIELRFAGERLPAIKSFDQNGYVIYLGSFSKICVPGARIGWICADTDMLARFEKIKQAADLQPNTTAQCTLTKFMQMYNMDEHISTLPGYYKEKAEVMLEAMEKEFPEGVKFTRSEGGLFTWVTLPEGMNATEMFKKAVTEEKVAFVPGQPFFSEPGHENHMRISYSKASKEQIREGVARLAKLIRENM